PGIATSARAPPAAASGLRFKADPSNPAARDTMTIAASAITTPQNSPAVTPPISNGTDNMGNTANSAVNDRTAAEANLPRTMSIALKSVRNNSPSVPSRFSSASESAVVRGPSSRQKTNAPHD